MYSCIQKAVDDRGKFFIIEALQKSRLLHRRQLFGGNLFPSGKPGGLTGIGAPEGGISQYDSVWKNQPSVPGQSVAIPGALCYNHSATGAIHAERRESVKRIKELESKLSELEDNEDF